MTVLFDLVFNALADCGTTMTIQSALELAGRAGGENKLGFISSRLMITFNLSGEETQYVWPHPHTSIQAHPPTQSYAEGESNRANV